MKNMVQALKGMRDFYPEEMAMRNWLYKTIREVSESYGYQEWEGPFLEKIDLYAAKSGDELVKEQAFVFPDRGGDLITLRPELTPTLARMVAQRQKELTFPLKWWSFGPMWRYERPQKGRSREFFQWNIDTIGANSPEVDAELVSICASLFKKVGLTPDKVKIFVNDRRLMDAEFTNLNISSELKKGVFRLIDRKDKMQPEAWEKYALEIGLSQDQLDGIKTLLSSPELWKKSKDMQRFFVAADVLGITEYVHYNAQVIRGLDYYTGTVFEAYDSEGGRAILGGGHYDNLVADVGGDSLPGVGFAMGDIMFPLVLKDYQLLPSFDKPSAEVLITVFDEGFLTKSSALGYLLRSEGIRTLVYPEAVKLPKQFKYADQMKIPVVIVLGPDEEQNGLVTVKNLITRSQETVAKDHLVEKVKQILA